MLRRLDGIGAHAIEIDARDLAMLREDGLQSRYPHLDRLLHHIIKPCRFKRCEQILQVAGGGLLSCAIGNAQRRVAPAAFEHGAPFAVAAVEEQDFLPVCEPQHSSKVMGLGTIERDRSAGGKRSIAG